MNTSRLVRVPLTVFYDRSCPMCSTEMHALRDLDWRGRLRLVDCSAPEFDAAQAAGRNVTREALMRRMHVRDPEGRWLVGVEAFEAVYAAGTRAVAAARNGGGPYILEMKTYRYRGHSMSDPAKYRTREEVQEIRSKRDPIETFGARLVSEGLLSEEDLKAFDKDVRTNVNRAAEFATDSPEPAPEELYTDILK